MSRYGPESRTRYYCILLIDLKCRYFQCQCKDSLGSTASAILSSCIHTLVVTLTVDMVKESHQLAGRIVVFPSQSKLCRGVSLTTRQDEQNARVDRLMYDIHLIKTHLTKKVMDQHMDLRALKIRLAKAKVRECSSPVNSWSEVDACRTPSIKQPKKGINTR